MANITLKGNPINTCGEIPTTGSAAPDFSLVAKDLSEKSLADYQGENLILNIVPSFDTPVCAKSVIAFNEKAAEIANTKILNISKDLPFAQTRFCDASQVDHVINLSNFRSDAFGNDYGIEITDGPLKGLLGRAVVVLNESHQVIHAELVPEIAQEPNYDAALDALSQIS